jgi:hypothetical protein
VDSQLLSWLSSYVVYIIKSLLGYNAMQSIESQPTFWWNMSPPSLGSKNETRRNQDESWWQAEPPKRHLTFNGLHGVMPQKIEQFITTTVRTWNLVKTLLWEVDGQLQEMIILILNLIHPVCPKNEYGLLYKLWAWGTYFYCLQDKASYHHHHHRHRRRHHHHPVQDWAYWTLL